MYEERFKALVKTYMSEVISFTITSISFHRSFDIVKLDCEKSEMSGIGPIFEMSVTAGSLFEVAVRQDKDILETMSSLWKETVLKKKRFSSLSLNPDSQLLGRGHLCLLKQLHPIKNRKGII